MELIADRFVVRDGRAVDLGSADEVLLVTSSAGGVAEQRRWALRCQRFATLHHPSIACLLDFGILGETRRFEAWRAGPVWNGPRVLAAHVLGQANALLQATGATISSAPRVHTWNGQPVIVPGPDAGFEIARGAGHSEERGQPSMFALEHLPRPAIAAIAELLTDPTRHEVCAVALWGARGAGIRSATRDIARAARLNGVVPLAASMDCSGVRALLPQRTLLLIDDGTSRGGWRRLLESGIAAPRHHLLLLVGHEEMAHVVNVRLDPLPTEMLVKAIRPHGAAIAHGPAIARCAARARGLPGRFASLLRAIEPCSRRVSLAAERRAIYVVDPGAAVDGGEPSTALVWPVDGDVANQRRRLKNAVDQLRSGRRTAAVRTLRAVTCGLARRHDWRNAADGMIALAEALLKRGQLRQASAALDDASQFAQRAGAASHHGPPGGTARGDEDVLIDIAILTARLKTEQRLLSESETLLRGALSAARAREDHGRIATGLLGLVRVLFWQGRFDEAMRSLEEIRRLPASDRLTVLTSFWSSRLAASTVLRPPSASTTLAWSPGRHKRRRLPISASATMRPYGAMSNGRWPRPGPAAIHCAPFVPGCSELRVTGDKAVAALRQLCSLDWRGCRRSVRTSCGRAWPSCAIS